MEYTEIKSYDKTMPLRYRAKDMALIEVLERCRKNRTRLKLYYGDLETGKTYNEEFDIYGRIGLSKGNEAYYPLLVHNERSMGGGELSGNILRVRESNGNRVLYTHPKFIQPTVEIVPSDLPEYQFNTVVNGKLHGRHKAYNSAIKCKNTLI